MVQRDVLLLYKYHFKYFVSFLIISYCYLPELLLFEHLPTRIYTRARTNTHHTRIFVYSIFESKNLDLMMILWNRKKSQCQIHTIEFDQLQQLFVANVNWVEMLNLVWIMGLLWSIRFIISRLKMNLFVLNELNY